MLTDSGVAVGGTRVGGPDNPVTVGGTGDKVTVGGSDVIVGGSDVIVGGSDVIVGGIGVKVCVGGTDDGVIDAVIVGAAVVDTITATAPADGLVAAGSVALGVSVGRCAAVAVSLEI